MSPRAACRLERLGFTEVYDYVAGKADWRAAGLPTEGGPHPPRVLEQADRDPPVCGPDELVSAVAARLASTKRSSCVVVDPPSGVVLGRLRLDDAAGREEAAVEAVMHPGPSTVRADEDLAQTIHRLHERNAHSVLVTTPEGVLLGELRVPMDSSD
jgi:CBS domain-containing protein